MGKGMIARMISWLRLRLESAVLRLWNLEARLRISRGDEE
jgi:hypothetical protein